MTNEEKYKKALEEIARTVFPVYLKEDGKKYVHIENAVAIRNIAKEALK